MWKLFELLFHIQHEKSKRLNLFNSKKHKKIENPLMLKQDDKHNTHTHQQRGRVTVRPNLPDLNHSHKLACLAPLAICRKEKQQARSFSILPFSCYRFRSPSWIAQHDYRAILNMNFISPVVVARQRVVPTKCDKVRQRNVTHFGTQ